MANVLTKAVLNFAERFVETAEVLKITKWEPAIYEIVLYLPKVNMHKWNSIQRLKCKVSDGEYRDYTPATWDAEQRTCTILVEAEHVGYGSLWAQNLRVGHGVYFGAAHAALLPSATGKMLCFGDGSAIGHFMALKQHTNRNEYPLEVVITLNEEYTIPEKFINENPEFTFLMNTQHNNLDALTTHAEKMALEEYRYIYLVGNIPMIRGLRKNLKRSTAITARIITYGFWS